MRTSVFFWCALGLVGCTDEPDVTSTVDMLRHKFGRVPRATEKIIRATQDAGQLKTWLLRAGTVSTLEETAIGS